MQCRRRYMTLEITIQFHRLECFPVTQLLKDFPIFSETRRYIVMSTSHPFVTMRTPRIQHTRHDTLLRNVGSHKRHKASYPKKTFFIFTDVGASNLTFLHLFTLLLFSEECKLWRSPVSRCLIEQCPMFSSAPSSEVLSVLFTSLFNLVCSKWLRWQVAVAQSVYFTCALRAMEFA
jgi:hypothetical protein